MTKVPRFDYRVIMDTLSALDCARSLTVAILLRYQEYEQIVSLGFNPYFYNDVVQARDTLCATELLRKHADLPTGIDCHAVALNSFFACEDVCRITNERLRKSNSYAAELFSAQRKIADVLGDFDPTEMLDLSGWGPGVTISLRGKDATNFKKFRSKSEATIRLANLIKPWFSIQFPNWPVDPRIYEGNRVISVPKNAKTNRIIAVEPALNLFFQKGVGAMIRQRLSKWNVDLRDQSRNAVLAKQGSLTGSLATVDFSAASDTISYQLVLDLLPFNWFQVLDILRSPRGYIKDNDSLIVYEKFSSMGNGYTFELESLIFWALAKSVVPSDHPNYDDISVYGDDVIIPSEYVGLYTEVCNHCGFSVNEKKSFSDSNFRESCGSYWWNGQNIKPIYFRKYFSTIQSVVSAHNRIIDYSMMFTVYFRQKRFKQLINFIRSSYPDIPGVPLSYGDVGFSSVPPRRRVHHDYQHGYRFKILSPSKIEEEAFDDSVLLTRLYEIRAGDVKDIAFGNTCSVPRAAGRLFVKKAYTAEWCWLPDWA